MGMPLDLVWLTVPAYVVLQILALAWSSGRARLAAGAPLVVMVPVFVITVVGFAQESNLWPLVLLLTSPFAMLYAAVAAVLVRFARRPAAP